MEDTLEVFKQVKVNIPLLDAIKQVPIYAKFLKDLCTQKRKNRTNVYKKVLLTEQVSSVFQSDAPPKLQDPGTPTIDIVIGKHAIERALLDLGASVNLIPYSVYEQLGLGELKPTSVTLQLADRSIKVPRGVIEDVLVKVNDFYFPTDFIVLDTEPVQTLKKQSPIILGRPFLATANANIHVRSGEMEVTFGNMTLKLNVYKAARPSPVEEDCFAVDVLEDLVEEALPSILTDDPLAACLAHFDFENFDIDQSIEEVNTLLGSTHLMVTPPRQIEIEPAPTLVSEPPTPFVGSPLELELQPVTPESMAPCADLVEAITIDYGPMECTQSWGVGDSCIDIHGSEGDMESNMSCPVLIFRGSFETLPFKHIFPWYDEFIRMVTRGAILAWLCDPPSFIFIVGSDDIFWNDPSRLNFKRRIKLFLEH